VHQPTMTRMLNSKRKLGCPGVAGGVVTCRTCAAHVAAAAAASGAHCDGRYNRMERTTAAKSAKKKMRLARCLGPSNECLATSQDDM